MVTGDMLFLEGISTLYLPWALFSSLLSNTTETPENGSLLCGCSRGNVLVPCPLSCLCLGWGVCGGQLYRAGLVRSLFSQKMPLTGSSCLEPRSPSSGSSGSGHAVAEGSTEVGTGCSPHSRPAVEGVSLQTEWEGKVLVLRTLGHGSLRAVTASVIALCGWSRLLFSTHI